MKLILLISIMCLFLFTGCPRIKDGLCYGCEEGKHPYEIQQEDPRYYQSITVLGIATHTDSLITTKKAHINADMIMKKQFQSEVDWLIKSLQREDSTLVMGCDFNSGSLLNSDSIITTDNQIIEKRDDGRYEISILKYVSAINLLALFDSPCFQGNEEALRKSKTYNDLLVRISKDRENMREGD